MIRTFFCTLLIFIIFPIFPKATANLIHSSYLYKTAQTDNELSPFSGKTPLICLNKGSKVKILDEFETSAMHGNILFVEIADGKTGYIEKSSVIPEEYADIKFFTNIQIKDLPKNSTLSFLYSGMDGLHFEDKNKKTFILENLENVRFILNRKAENRYRYNNGCIIVKAIDMQTLRPLTNAKLNNIKIESDGYCYLDKKDVGKDFLLECDGYESKKVTVNKKINLFFLSAFHSIKEENNADNKNICTVKINSISEISQIYFRKENSFVMHSADSQEISLSKGKYEIIYETVEGGFYPLQQFINLRNDSANTSDILKNANRDRSNSLWREVPRPAESNAIWKILFLKGKNINSDVSSLKYELEFIDSGFNFYRNNRLVAGGYFVRDNENIRLHWNFGYGMQASLFSCGVVVSGKIRENIGTGIYEFEIDYKKFEPKVADKIKMPWLPDIFNKENILFIKKTN